MEVGMNEGQGLADGGRTKISRRCSTMNLKTIVASKLMLPSDTNPAGNVHGGTILRFMTDGGAALAAKRFVNKGDGKEVHVAICRIEHMDFFEPMFVGEVAEIEAQVTYASSSTVEVTVNVYAETLTGKTRRLTNRATVWYVAIEETTCNGKLVCASSIPKVQFSSDAERVRATERYNKQVADRKKRNEYMAAHRSYDSKLNWTTRLAQVVLPSDCYQGDWAQGGIILKLIDNAAGVSAFRHCKTNVVTASLETLDFKRPVFKGNMIEIFARPSFASSKSLEIEVAVWAEDLRTEERWLAIDTFLVFVSLDEKGKPLPVSPLPEPQTELEKKDREEGLKRYNARKQARLQELKMLKQ